MIGVTFGDKHSYDDFGLILTNEEVGMPEPKTETVSVIGHQGDIDLTESLSDEITYKNRTLTYTFQIRHSDDWASLLSEVANALHGKKLRVIPDDDAQYYYYGRVTVDKYAADRRLGTLTVKVDAGPYKIDRNSPSETGDDWLWDPFSFVDGIVYTSSYTVSGTLTVTLLNRSMITSPTFTCSAAMTVTFDGTDYELEEGTTTITDIRLQEGENELTFTGTGTVVISYSGGSL